MNATLEEFATLCLFATLAALVVVFFVFAFVVLVDVTYVLLEKVDSWRRGRKARK